MINEYTTLEHIINDGSAKECNEDQTYYNEPESSANNTKISISRLVKYVDKKTHDDLSEEFKIFPRGLVKSYVESQKRENTNDDSRVKVMVSGGSDYINASFIDGYKRPKQYIATLAPMSQQLGDFSLFWKMIWQQRVEKIVMVTNLIEQGSHKCEQYWPDPGTTKAYGEIQVESRSEDEYAEFTRRTFTVTTQLQHMVDKRSKDETEAVELYKQLLSKNRANADIPGKGNRHSLYQNLKLGASVNIDAVYIDSFGIKKRYLVAKTPLPETVLEFLTLVVQEKCSCIVSFPDDMDKQK
ncbi:PTPRT-like protein, partial [Mya arenaria]